MNKKPALGLVLSLALLALPMAATAHNGIDHNPHHGGVLKPFENNHFEAVLVPGGIQVFFSKASGEQLPASSVAQMEIEIERPDMKTEYVAMTIDPTGVFWMGKSKPLADPKSMVRIGFLLEGKSGLVEVKGGALLAAQKMTADKAADAKPADKMAAGK